MISILSLFSSVQYIVVQYYCSTTVVQSFLFRGDSL